MSNLNKFAQALGQTHTTGANKEKNPLPIKETEKLSSKENSKIEGVAPKIEEVTLHSQEVIAQIESLRQQLKQIQAKKKVDVNSQNQTIEKIKADELGISQEGIGIKSYLLKILEILNQKPDQSATWSSHQKKRKQKGIFVNSDTTAQIHEFNENPDKQQIIGMG